MTNLISVKLLIPYRRVENADFSIQRQRNEFSVWKSVFNSIVSMLDGFVYPTTERGVVDTFVIVSDCVFKHFIPPRTTRKRKQRDEELCMATLYRHVKAYKKLHKQ